jgi:hypothetical protein
MLATAGTAEARWVTEKDAQGGIRAELSYDRSGDEFSRTYRDFALSIYQDDVLVFERELTSCCRGYEPAYFGRKPSVAVGDLDGGEPEVRIDFYTGGAYCCWLTSVYRPRNDTYAHSSHSWGPKKQRLVELGGGPPEFLSHDDSFLRPYGCNFCWRYLPHVWRFDEGTFQDVTRRHPAQVRAKSKKLRRRYFRASHRGDDVKPIVAPYVATTYLLGEPRTGWRLVRRAARRAREPSRPLRLLPVRRPLPEAPPALPARAGLPLEAQNRADPAHLLEVVVMAGDDHAGGLRDRQLDGLLDDVVERVGCAFVSRTGGHAVGE